MPPAEREFPRVCPRCGEADVNKCMGRFSLLSCKAVIDGKNIYDEALELLDARYAPQTPVDGARPALMRLHYGDDILVPWEADKDKRPRAKGGPREGQEWPFPIGGVSAMHGECTPCVKEAAKDRGDTGKTISVARWRRQHGPNPEDFVYSIASYCDFHANRFASAPIEVPEFTTAEEAQRWLDEITEARTG